MCLIAIKNSGAELPKDEHLREASIRNKDGVGIAYLKSGTSEVHIKKDFINTEAFIDWLHHNITKEDICIIHFRLATHGLVDMGNRHPFPITKNKDLLRKTELICQMAVAHNGVLSQYSHAKFSDTQKFVLDILSEETVKTNLDNPVIMKLINNFLNGDRLVVLRNDGMIFRWGSWVEEGEIMYSNSSYKVYLVSYYNKAYSENGLNSDGRTCEDWDNFCEICGGYQDIKRIKYKTLHFCLCKACRKNFSKGDLKLKDIYELKLEEIRMAEEEEEKDKIPLADRQCESCFDWILEKEIVNYYGTKLCSKCVNDVLGYFPKK